MATGPLPSTGCQNVSRGVTAAGGKGFFTIINSLAQRPSTALARALHGVCVIGSTVVAGGVRHRCYLCPPRPNGLRPLLVIHSIEVFFIGVHPPRDHPRPVW
jgi:hypothetical protein